MRTKDADVAAADHEIGAMTAEDVIRRLDLARHPEGGWFRETWAAEGDGRPAGTCIYFLLAAGERSHWHRVDAAEIWHFYAGAPLTLRISQTDAGPAARHRLTADITDGLPQVIVPPHAWQSAETTGDWTLCGCTVSPGFRFETFDLAPPDFAIPDA